MIVSINIRYIAYNAILWLAVLAGGLAFLVTFRQYGQAVTEQHKARTALAAAEASYREGASTEAQQAVLRILDASPQLAGEIVDRIGADLLGMPRVYDALAAHYAAGDDTDTLGRAKQALLAGRNVQAKEGFESLAGQRSGGTDAELWLGRMALASGDLEGARDRFERYWKATKLARKQVVDDQFGAESNPEKHKAILIERGIEIAYRLLWAGLWDEAMETADAAEKAGAHDPEFGFFRGMAAELKGQSAAALEFYSQVLAKRPTHRLSLLRLTVLTAGAKL